MPLNLASPGIVVREVDLTLGRATPASNKVGGLVAPFAKGPVDVPTLVENEQGLLDNFGEPYAVDKHYEHWLVASSYLAYGGSLRIIRADDADMKNSVGSGSSIKIKSLDHYNQLGYDENTIPGRTIVARNPGSWANGIRVSIIDAKADQILSGISTTQVAVTSLVNATTGVAGTTTLGSNSIGIDTTGLVVGQVITPQFGGTVFTTNTQISSIGIGTVFVSNNASSGVTTAFNFGSYVNTATGLNIQVGYGVTQSAYGRVDPASGSEVTLQGYIKGVVTQVGVSSVFVKVISYVDESGTETKKDYQQLGVYTFSETGNVAIHTTATGAAVGTTSYTAESDWFDRQNIGITTSSTIPWNTVTERPSTTSYAAARNSRFDEVHIVVIDAEGKITGNAGTILEKHVSLSKAKDAQFSVGSPSYWRKYLANNSRYIFGGSEPTGVTTTGFSSNFELSTDIGWDQDAQNILFAATGSTEYILSGGLDYNGQAGITTTGALTSTLGNLSQGYDLFENTDNYQIDFLLMGSANYDKSSAQALANKIISVAELRKDTVAFISPYRGAFLSDSAVGSVTVNSDATITDNVISFYSPITSSSYGIFDSGYKYMYDRFSDTFRYVPMNGDLAGICARNDINNFPWFSPAGTARGAILNAVKLAFNPTKSQRDRLYSNRINPIIYSPGAGIILFGDKTGLGRASAFDRINVRRLFIYLENAISAAAKDQLFEFNDEITRTNFVNTVEPFLRDVQAKRGIQDYIVVCDETNNTAAVIDNNEFIADIYIKPARSINFIGLTFIATKTGVNFEEIIGTV
jgi:hypothetical protein